MLSDLSSCPICLIVSYHGQFQRFSILIIQLTHCWWRRHVYQYVSIFFVFPHHGSQVTHVIVSLSARFSLIFYLQNLVWLFCLFWQQVTIIYDFCPTSSIFAVSLVTAVSAVITGVTHLLSLPKYTVILCYLESHGLSFIFLWYMIFANALAFVEDNSNFKC